MERIQLIAPAKINLSLRILGKRPDGFHELETLMAPLKLSDAIELSHGSGGGIGFVCNDPELPTGAENLCVRAAEVFRDAVGLEHGVTISLMKRIPHGAGLGGGSSDAASVLLGLNQLYDNPLVMEELVQAASRLGSDVTFFLSSGPACCRGRGEIIEPAEPLPERRIMLIKPPFPIPTPWAYQQYAEKAVASQLPKEDPQWLGSISLHNDLEAPVFDKHLLLPVLKQWLREQGCVESAFMTGSGSTMVAIMKPVTSEAEIASMREKIVEEFGATLWICETGFATPSQ